MKKRILILLASILLARSSCVKDIYLDAGEKPKVVVECVLTEDPVQELYLSYTKGVSQKEAEPLLEAEARLIDLDRNNVSVTFDNAGEGRWTVNFSPYPGHKYRLEINIPGYDFITAETTMPSFVDVRQVYYNPLTFYARARSGGASIEEVDGYGYSGGSYYYNIPDHCWVYSINEDGSIAETICTNYPWVDNFNLTGGSYDSDTLRIKDSWGPEGEERDATLYPVLIGEALHDRYLRITKGERSPWVIVTGLWDDTYNYKESISRLSKAYQISGSFYTYQEQETGYFRMLGKLCFDVLSEEYDDYLVAAFKGAQLEESTDISKIFLRENTIQSNIHGGLGIFGAKKSQMLEWSKYYSSIDFPIPSRP